MQHLEEHATAQVAAMADRQRSFTGLGAGGADTNQQRLGQASTDQAGYLETAEQLARARAEEFVLGELVLIEAPQAGGRRPRGGEWAAIAVRPR